MQILGNAIEFRRFAEIQEILEHPLGRQRHHRARRDFELRQMSDVRVGDQPGIGDVGLTTNGVKLPEMASDLKAAGLTRINISLDSLRPSVFKAITGFDPQEHPRLGFTYAVIDRELGEQTLTVGSPMPYQEDPSLWATLELREKGEG